MLIELARMPASLDTIRTTDRPLRADMRPTIDSSEIAGSSRAVLYLEDVIRKLRPGMFYQAYKCHSGASSPPLRVYVAGEYVPPELLRALRLDIHAEQIAEMHYVNCFDRSLGNGDHPQAGHLYITLKKGYAFDLKRGTYSLHSAPQAASSPTDHFLARYRGRLVGLFDAVTGSPIAGATVTDLATGMSASTSSTGTVSLLFVDTSGSVIRLTKPGYASQVLAIDNSPGSSDLTLLLEPAIPKARTTAVSDSSSKLDLVGFTFRRSVFAPSGALFFTSEELPTFATVSRVFELVPDGSCHRGNVRIDGGSVMRDSSANGGWIDRLLLPDMVSGIEVYRSDSPTILGDLANAVEPGQRGASSRCTTLIWTR